MIFHKKCISKVKTIVSTLLPEVQHTLNIPTYKFMT